MKKNILGFAIIVMAFSNLLLAQEVENKNTKAKFDPARDPFADVKAAVEEAGKNQKRIMLDVGGEWCIWCHRLDKFIDENEEIKTLLHENYIVIKVNYSPENKNEKFLSQFPKVPGYPHIFILDETGKFLHSQDTGKLEKDKSYNAQLLLDFLKEWSPKK